MKKMRFHRKLRSVAIVLSVVLMASCGKYRKYDNSEVIEDTYTGSILVGSTGSDPGGDFTGDGNSGTYAFAWDNDSKKAHANFDITSSSGSVQMIIQDRKGDEVLNQTLTAGSGEDSFSGVSSEGKPGTWKVSLIIVNFDGDGSYSLNPRD